MPHDPTRVAEAREWMVAAAQDLRAAEHGMSAEPPLAADVAFHCQQAVEKAAKALLAWHDHPFRKTHDLVELGNACVGIDGLLESVLRPAAPLTEYAWRFRYPGEPQEPGLEEVRRALALAHEAYQAILARMPPEARQ